MSLPLLQCLVAFVSTLALIFTLAPAARSIGLVDIPTRRKHHRRAVPLIGGLAIFLTWVLGAWIWGDTEGARILMKDGNSLRVLLACGGFIVFIGALDDRFQLGVGVRVVSEILVALAVIEFLDLRIIWLGDLIGVGALKLQPAVSHLFTIIAVFGLINAFNMLDGIDGLLGSVVITTLISFHALTSTEPNLITLFIVSSLLAFLVSNLGLSSIVPKSFLGDAGSKLLGFVVVCLLLGAASSQVGGAKLIQPVTALYLVAIPLFDMAFTTGRRCVQGRSPFSADRSHLHHLLPQLGLSERQSLILVVTLSLFMSCLGLLLNRLEAPEYSQLSLFIAAFVVYCMAVGFAWSAVDALEH